VIFEKRFLCTLVAVSSVFEGKGSVGLAAKFVTEGVSSPRSVGTERIVSNVKALG